jgi:hypothetical protein
MNSRKSLSETGDFTLYGEAMSIGSFIKRSHFWMISVGEIWNVSCGWTRATVFDIDDQ